MKKTILIFFLIITACNANKDIIRECLDNHKQKSLDYIQDFSIYNSYTLLENSLVKKGLLKRNKKESYIKLLEKIKLNNNEVLLLKEELAKKVKDFDLLAHPTVYNSPFNCVKYYLINNDLDEGEVSLYLKEFEKLLVEDTQLNIQAINSIPSYSFKDFHFRLPVLATIYLKLYNVDGSGKIKF